MKKEIPVVLSVFVMHKIAGFSKSAQKVSRKLKEFWLPYSNKRGVNVEWGLDFFFVQHVLKNCAKSFTLAFFDVYFRGNLESATA